ncbi:hypothetical protein Drorol1_Dr00009368 [Drosera rotundifolia]
MNIQPLLLLGRGGLIPAFRRLPPRRHRTPPLTLPLSSPMRMINRIHRDTPHLRPNPPPPVLSRLPQLLLDLMARARHGPHDGSAFGVDELFDAGGESDEDIAGGCGVLGDLGRGAGGADEFGALIGADLEGVDDGADSEVGEWEDGADLGGHVEGGMGWRGRCGRGGGGGEGAAAEEGGDGGRRGGGGGGEGAAEF